MPDEKKAGDEGNEEIEAFPELILDTTKEEEEQVTLVTPLHELPVQARIDHEIAVIAEHHERIAKSIKVFWGHRDCVEYLEQLVLSGGDGAGKTRIGFRLEVIAALINLTTMHEVTQDWNNPPPPDN